MPTSPETAAIILSGGSSSRMQFPKALLSYGRETFIERLIRLFSNHCSTVVAVTGAHTADIHAGVKENAATWVHNTNWPAGQLSSLQSGIRALPPAIARCFWIPVDYPAVQEETIVALLDAWTPDNLFTIPRSNGKNGHPILASREALDVLDRLPLTASARDVIHSSRSRTRFVDVSDSGILLDVDDRDAYALLPQVNT